MSWHSSERCPLAPRGSLIAPVFQVPLQLYFSVYFYQQFSLVFCRFSNQYGSAIEVHFGYHYCVCSVRNSSAVIIFYYRTIVTCWSVYYRYCQLPSVSTFYDRVHRQWLYTTVSGFFIVVIYFYGFIIISELSLCFSFWLNSIFDYFTTSKALDCQTLFFISLFLVNFSIFKMRTVDGFEFFFNLLLITYVCNLLKVSNFSMEPRVMRLICELWTLV